MDQPDVERGHLVDGSRPEKDDGSIIPADRSSSNDAKKSNTPRKGPKKRTKTGCLTCRKRRIKCGEEKPICNNCIKSKRECEGYAQRVVFKHPMGIFGTFGHGQTPNAQAQLPMPMRVPLSSGLDGQAFQQRPANSHQPILAPRPVDFSVGVPSLEGTHMATPFYYPPVQMRAPLPPGIQASTISESLQTPAGPVSRQQPETFSDGNSVYYSTQPLTSGLPPVTYNSLLPQGPHDRWTVPSAQAPFMDNSFAPGHLQTSAVSDGITHAPVPIFENQPRSQFSAAEQAAANQTQLQQHEQPQLQRHTFISPGPVPYVAYVDDESDDLYDVESDEEMADQTQAEDFNQLSLIMSSANRDEHQLRSFAPHPNEPNILASYRPSLGSTPLNNPKTARIFVHFIHSTGPSFSIFERHPTDSSVILGEPVPTAQQGLWTYTLPLKAMEHPALLQAILAISSLHISMLQQAPIHVSLKHYQYALKHVGRAVGLPTRRKHIGTLAATLLLGYYEVMAAEHYKWNSHVAGSGQLIRDVDWAGTTRDLRAHRRRMRAQREQMARPTLWFGDDYSSGNFASEDDPFAEKESSIDQGLIGALLGRAVNYDEFGQVDEGPSSPMKKHFTRKDIENFRIQCDLYWWYCKQDLFQSMISGNRLFMPYYQWGQCPPRAGIGRLDAIYGSMDHLVLLLGRLMDFGYRDRKRKLKSAKSTGIEWRPNQGFFKFMARFAGGGQNMRSGPSSGPPTAPPPGAAFGAPPFAGGMPGPRPQGHPFGEYPEGGPVRPPPANMPNMSQSQGDNANQREQTPPMYGMVPPRGPTRLPSAFSPSAYPSNVPPDLDDEDDEDEITYNDAEDEWEGILASFDVFTAALGRDYQPLPADVTPPISTPFGAALQYRTHTIAVLLGFYYAGRILLHRLHPSMPPAMMVAAGVAAPATAEFSQTIGKIAAGIYYPQRYNLEAGSLSPTLGASLVEMTVPVFFAAVQYTDPAQRGWTIAKLRDIARLTGWKTSNAIAAGCENAWVTAAKKGRGPPYQRTGDASESRRARTETPEPQTNGEVPPETNLERRFIAVKESGRRVHWAMGLLSIEDDLVNLELDGK